MHSFPGDFPYRSQRMPVLARNAVTTSQPLAAQAGLIDAAAVETLGAWGHSVEVAGRDSLEFGGAQLIQRTDAGYVAASDSRRDGQAVGF